jgi:hypothetical protein
VPYLVILFGGRRNRSRNVENRLTLDSCILPAMAVLDTSRAIVDRVFFLRSLVAMSGIEREIETI